MEAGGADRSSTYNSAPVQHQFKKLIDPVSNHNNNTSASMTLNSQ